MENKYALKTGYGRYVSINTAGELTGRAEAIGPRETWEPVFEDVRIGRGKEGVERESSSVVVIWIEQDRKGGGVKREGREKGRERRERAVAW